MQKSKGGLFIWIASLTLAMTISVALIFAMTSVSFAQENENIDNSRFFKKAVIQVLNKVNAKSDLVEIAVNKKTNINSLEIIIHKCWQAPLDQRPESKILLEILDEKSSEGKSAKKRIFYGWMFASSPSVSTFEHPIYDIIAINCKN
jgi:hypothetical protein